MRIADGRCEVRPGTIDTPDLTVRMPALLFLAIHRGEASPVWGLVTGRIRLAGRRRLFLHFPRLFRPTAAEQEGDMLARRALLITLLSALAMPPVLHSACMPFPDPDDAGCVPPDDATLACSDDYAHAAGDFARRVMGCHIMRATRPV